MIVNSNNNIYWHGVVKNIYTGVSEQNNIKYSVVKAYGKCSVVDTKKGTGTHVMKQDLTIFAMSGLSCYVDSEIDVDDKIFVVGKLVTKTKKKGGMYYYEQCIQAEEIYKNDWIKYYIK